MRELAGALLIVNGIIVGIFLLRERALDWKGFLALCSVSLIAGVVVANLPRITQLVFSGGGQGITVQMQQQVEKVEGRAKEVEELAAEVRNIREQVTLVLQNANTANEKIDQSEKRIGELVKEASNTKGKVEAVNTEVGQSAEVVKAVQVDVTTMQGNIQQSIRSIFESFAYSMGTRNIFPPPPFVGQAIDRHLNLLATFAYPDLNERNREIQRIMADIRRAQGQPEGQH